MTKLCYTTMYIMTILVKDGKQMTSKSPNKLLKFNINLSVLSKILDVKINYK